MLVLVGCSGGSAELAPSTSPDLADVTVTTEPPAVPLSPPAVDDPPQRGGVVRVGIWVEPDPDAVHIGGDIVRSLTHPQLFTARPGGGWAPRLVEPGSVVESADLREVSFRLREGVVWSDGTPIGASDLQRSADTRFVESVTGVDGQITVRFAQPLPGWRRLWSGFDTVTPPSAGIVGGPFRVAEVVDGLETVLVPNESWWGVGTGEGPWLDELRLLVVPDQTTLLQLFDRGELDVIAPWQAPGLRTYLCSEERADGEAGVACETDVDQGGGWETTVVLDPDAFSRDTRRSLLTGFDPDEFVGSLLKGEATVLPFPGLDERDVAALSNPVTFSLAEDVPMLGAMARAVQLQVDDNGGTVPELRLGPTRLVTEWAATGDYQVLLAETYQGPSPCWTCMYGDVLPGEAALADAGDPAPLRERLAADALARPLWTADRVVAWTADLAGIEANAWALFVTWNAWQWFTTSAP